MRLGNPDDPNDLELLKRMSPINSADRIRVPLLVIQGANDPRVNKAESEQIVVSLRDRGMPVEYLLAPDEGHGFAGRENRLAIATAMEKFFARHLGGRYQESMPDDIATKLASLTVDPATVTVSKAPPGGAAMEGAMVTGGDGTALAPMTLTYTTTVKMMGREQQYGSTRTVTAATFDERPVWRIVDGVQMQGVTAVDTLDVDRTTLVPVRRSAAGGAKVTLRFTDTKVTGTLEIGPQSIPVDLESTDAVFGDGASRDVLLAGLPLTDGYVGTMQMLELLTQKIRPFSISVTGSETVTTGAGTFETWVLAVTPLDGDESGSGTLNVTQAAPHLVVRGTVKLPAMMGGGTQETELTGRQ